MQSIKLPLVSLLTMLLLIPIGPTISNQVDIYYVDDDNTQGPWDGSSDHPFQSIQEAIDHVESGDWVFVHSGWYGENILINKPLHLLGEDKFNTTIDGGGHDDVIKVLTDQVTISGFTIQNSSNQLHQGLWWKAGIRILGSHITIIDNVISHNLQGIFMKQSENLTLLHNQFIHDGLTIYPYDTGYKTRPELNISHFVHRIDNNTVNGKPLIYLRDKKDTHVASNAGQVILVNCSNVTLQHVTIHHTDFPLIYAFCSECLIKESYFSDNEGICVFLDSDENTIVDSIFHHNLHGFLLDYYSESNVFEHNVFSNNRFCGVVCEQYSNENEFRRNDFVDNSLYNAFVIKAFQTRWMNNYWSDWVGVDHPLLQVFPKIIYGTHFDHHQRIKSYVNIDWDPLTEPQHQE